MSSSSSNTGSGGFGITLHHEGQNDQNSLSPSPLSGTTSSGKQEAKTLDDSQSKHTNQAQSTAGDQQQGKSAKQGQQTLNDDEIRNNKP